MKGFGLGGTNNNGNKINNSSKNHSVRNMQDNAIDWGASHEVLISDTESTNHTECDSSTSVSGTDLEQEISLCECSDKSINTESDPYNNLVTSSLGVLEDDSALYNLDSNDEIGKLIQEALMELVVVEDEGEEELAF